MATLQTPPAAAYMQHSPQSTIHSHGNGYARHNVEDWSGAEESAGDDMEEDGSSKKRKRPMSVSCEMCKMRKVKCDRGQPTCGWCAKNNQLCEYKERKKPGLRAGYGRELEARLDRLEGILHHHQQAIEQLTGASPHTLSSVGHDPSNNMFSGSSLTHDQSMHSHAGQHASNRSHSFSTPATPNVSPAFRRATSQYSNYAQQVQPTYAAKPEAIISPSTDQPYSDAAFSAPRPPSATDSRMISQDHDLPPYDLLYSLADLYFKHINTWCPILHRRTTLDLLFGTSNLDEGDKALLHAIIAATLRFSSDPRLTQDKMEAYHAVSKQKVIVYAMENLSVKSLQALVILALDICGTSNGPPGWNVLALLTRSAVQLGLSVEATSPANVPRYASIYTLRAMVLPESGNWIEDESRRRLFWMIYVLDRYSTIQTAFNFALDEKEIDRRLPCRDDMFARNTPTETRWFKCDRADQAPTRPDNLGSFSYYVEIVGILSSIHEFLKKPVDIAAHADVERWQNEYRELDQVLSSWKLNLPKEYGSMTRLFDGTGGGANKIVNCGWVMLHATYHTTVIRLHSSAAYPSNRSHLFAPSRTASQRSLDAVDQIHTLCGHVRSAGMLNKLGPPFAFTVWVASRLLLVHSSTVDHQINPMIHAFVGVLRELGSYWGLASRYATVLQRVLDEFAESERAPAIDANGERITPSSVRILADMRRCAYDLDYLISKQPRCAPASYGSNGNGGGGGVPGQPTGAPNGLEGPGQTPGATPGAVPIGEVPTTTRTPAPNELEYLDVFEFFNVPRLQVGLDGMVPPGVTAMVPPAFQQQQGAMPGQPGTDLTAGSLYDTNTDWFGPAGPE